ncbi:hypothetical protein [Deinococcus aerophilus]|uniref:Uncharacterized protein n=1 Tax=Deinococcus aerophilus TaxID=522488 RepID=A0ABQ2GMD8_9DEIO|nr:hypothetical protein [Deinococcus aerophilus]GGM02506.1 hypothetical protein GCM10010841_08800 [Deinococcus aerophilus]
MSKTLLSVDLLRQDYGLGRDLATHFVRLLPHIKMGRRGCGERLLIKRADFEHLIDRAAAERVDLWRLARQHTPETLQAWLVPIDILETN